MMEANASNLMTGAISFTTNTSNFSLIIQVYVSLILQFLLRDGIVCSGASESSFIKYCFHSRAFILHAAHLFSVFFAAFKRKKRRGYEEGGVGGLPPARAIPILF
ncbi:hypothetical protein Dimus_009716 [Dionaea muscipula]